MINYNLKINNDKKLKVERICVCDKRIRRS
jgi:hypothetical protein